MKDLYSGTSVEPVTITVTTFKQSGKYYSEETVDLEVEVLRRVVQRDDGSQLFAANVMTWQVLEKLRARMSSGESGCIPGLTGDGWEGPILVTADDMAPHVFPAGTFARVEDSDE